MNRTRTATAALAAILALGACGIDPSPSASAPQASEAGATPGPATGAPSTTAPASASAAPSVPAGVTWTAATVPASALASGMVDVAPGGDGLVAIGFDGAFGTTLWTSADGIAWRDVTPDGFEGVGIAAVIEFDDRLIGVGRGDTLDVEAEKAAAYVSDTGVTWREAEGNEELLGQMVDVLATADGLYAVGGIPGADSAGLWFSADGEAWARTGADLDHAFLWSAAEGGPGLVAVGWRRNPEQPDMAVWTSPDGEEWTLAPDPPESAGFEATDVVSHDGLLVLAGSSFTGEGGRIWVSEDGTDWQLADVTGMDDGAYARTLVSTPFGLVAVGGHDMDARAWISADGRSWQPFGDAVPNAYFNGAVATDDGRLVVTGATQEGTLETGIDARAMIWIGTLADD